MTPPDPARRHIIKTALAGAAGAALGAPVGRLAAAVGQAASPSPSVQRLTDDLFVIAIPGEANVVAHTRADGVVLVDGASAAGSDALLKAVASLPGGRAVQAVFNT